MKWVIIIALVVLAPTAIIKVFSTGVSFVSSHGRALVSDAAHEASKTIKEIK